MGKFNQTGSRKRPNNPANGERPVTPPNDDASLPCDYKVSTNPSVLLSKKSLTSQKAVSSDTLYFTIEDQGDKAGTAILVFTEKAYKDRVLTYLDLPETEGQHTYTKTYKELESDNESIFKLQIHAVTELHPLDALSGKSALTLALSGIKADLQVVISAVKSSPTPLS